MTKMQHVEVKQWIAAPREKVFSVYTNYVGWSRWAGIGRVRIEREGTPPPYGPGCIRVVSGGGREEILTEERPTSTTYRVISGLPMRDHLGEVFFSDDGDGTLVVWRCRFRMTIWGLGAPFRLIVVRVFRGALRGLAAHIAKQSGALEPP
jgi:hypothetical protein